MKHWVQGYNDGLSANVSMDDRDEMPVLSPESAAGFHFKEGEVMDFSRAEFEAELGLAGAELLAGSLEDAVVSTNRLALFVESFAVALL